MKQTSEIQIKNYKMLQTHWYWSPEWSILFLYLFNVTYIEMIFNFDKQIYFIVEKLKRCSNSK